MSPLRKVPFSKRAGTTPRSHRPLREHVELAVVRRALDLLGRADGPRRGVRPRRTVAVAAAGLVGMVSMFSLVSQNVLALGLQASSRTHVIFSNEVEGSNAAIYMDGQKVAGAGTQAAAQIGFKSAKLHGFCLLAPQSVAGVGLATLKLTAGETVDGKVDADATPISADNLFTSTKALSGQGDEISKMTLGQSADTVAATAGIDPSTGFGGTAGGFGLAASTMTISNFSSENYGIDLRGSINLPNLKITILPGDKTDEGECS